MDYTITLTGQELELMSKLLQEWPYKFVQPLLTKIGWQVDQQNEEKNKSEEIVSKWAN